MGGLRDPDLPGAEALVVGLGELAGRVGRFLAGLGHTADDVEIWLEHTSRWGYTFVGDALTLRSAPASTRVAIRTIRDGRVGSAGAAQLDTDLWRHGVERALATAVASGPSTFPAPSAREPGPLTFDPDLALALAPRGELRRIAHAFSDNTLHEAQRGDGLTSLKGALDYTVRRYVVGNRQGVVSSLHGVLDGCLEIDGAYGDAFVQLHAPESFQPIALLGARTYRSMPRTRVTMDDLGWRGQVPVVLHPRLLETLLRRFGDELFTADAQADGRMPYSRGDQLAQSGITLIDDSTLDGLATSRPFDDEGTATRRNPILVGGRLSSVLRERPPENPSLSTGSSYRGGGEGDAIAPPRPKLGSLLMERGISGFHEIVGALDRALLIHRVAGLEEADSATTRFRCPITWGVTLDRAGNSRLLVPGAWTVEGHLLSMPDARRGLLSVGALSRELYDTGSAILPYCVTYLDVVS